MSAAMNVLGTRAGTASGENTTPTTPTTLARARLALRRAELDAALEIQRAELDVLEAELAEAQPATPATATLAPMSSTALTTSTAPPDSASPTSSAGPMNTSSPTISALPRSTTTSVAPPAQAVVGSSTATSEQIAGSEDSGVVATQGVSDGGDGLDLDWLAGGLAGDAAEAMEVDVTAEVAGPVVGVAEHHDQPQGAQVSGTAAPNPIQAADAVDEAAIAADLAPADAGTPDAEEDELHGDEHMEVAPPQHEDVIEIDSDEEHEAAVVATGGMTPRDFSSRVFRLGSVATAVSGEWQTVTSMWAAQLVFEGAHDNREGPTRLPSTDIRSVSIWQSKRRLAATLDLRNRLEQNYVSLVARLYQQIRGLTFESVGRMYGRYGLIGIAYGLMQAYSLEPSDAIEVLMLDYVDLLHALRRVHLGVETGIDTSATVDEVLAALNPEGVAVVTSALQALLARLQQQADVASPPPASKSPRKRDEDDEDGAGGASGSASSSRAAKRPKGKSGGSPTKKRSIRA